MSSFLFFNNLQILDKIFWNSNRNISIGNLINNFVIATEIIILLLSYSYLAYLVDLFS